MYKLHTINGLGQITTPSFPTGETIGAAISTGALVGGLAMKDKVGTVLAIVGGAGLLTSGILLISKLSAKPSAPLPPPPPPPPPTPTSSSKQSKAEKIISYVKPYLPLIEKGIKSASSLFGAGQPSIMVVR
jgi:hypothetical protein